MGTARLPHPDPRATERGVRAEFDWARRTTWAPQLEDGASEATIDVANAALPEPEPMLPRARGYTIPRDLANVASRDSRAPLHKRSAGAILDLDGGPALWLLELIGGRTPCETGVGARIGDRTRSRFGDDSPRAARSCPSPRAARRRGLPASVGRAFSRDVTADRAEVWSRDRRRSAHARSGRAAECRARRPAPVSSRSTSAAEALRVAISGGDPPRRVRRGLDARVTRSERRRGERYAEQWADDPRGHGGEWTPTAIKRARSKGEMELGASSRGLREVQGHDGDRVDLGSGSVEGPRRDHRAEVGDVGAQRTRVFREAKATFQCKSGGKAPVSCSRDDVGNIAAGSVPRAALAGRTVVPSPARHGKSERPRLGLRSRSMAGDLAA